MGVELDLEKAKLMINEVDDNSDGQIDIGTSFACLCSCGAMVHCVCSCASGEWDVLVKTVLQEFKLYELPPSSTAANEKGNNNYTSGEKVVSPSAKSKPASPTAGAS